MDLDNEALVNKKLTDLINYHSLRLNSFNKKINKEDLLKDLINIYEEIGRASCRERV